MATVICWLIVFGILCTVSCWLLAVIGPMSLSTTIGFAGWMVMHQLEVNARAERAQRERHYREGR